MRRPRQPAIATAGPAGEVRHRANVPRDPGRLRVPEPQDSAVIADARRSEDEADELLVDGGWEDEVELPREPIPFPVRPAPGAIGPLNDLPLFAADAAVHAPATAPVNGKVVTLEELAQLVRRRKPRAKPVPEGQLALFAS